MSELRRFHYFVLFVFVDTAEHQRLRVVCFLLFKLFCLWFAEICRFYKQNVLGSSFVNAARENSSTSATESAESDGRFQFSKKSPISNRKSEGGELGCLSDVMIGSLRLS